MYEDWIRKEGKVGEVNRTTAHATNDDIPSSKSNRQCINNHLLSAYRQITVKSIRKRGKAYFNMCTFETCDL
jgi:hypothetical protein